MLLLVVSCSTGKSCETKNASTQTCTNNTAGNVCSEISSMNGSYHSCLTVGGIIVGTCDQYVEKYCSNNSGECDESDDAYHCPTVLNNTISGTCTARSYKYCSNSTDATTCVDAPNSQYQKYHCAVYGSKINTSSCIDEPVTGRYCATRTSLYNYCWEYNINLHYYCMFVGTINTGQCEYK